MPVPMLTVNLCAGIAEALHRNSTTVMPRSKRERALAKGARRWYKATDHDGVKCKMMHRSPHGGSTCSSFGITTPNSVLVCTRSNKLSSKKMHFACLSTFECRPPVSRVCTVWALHQFSRGEELIKSAWRSSSISL
jgi:hypothetical protein